MVYLQTYIFVLEVLYYAETLFLPAPATHSARDRCSCCPGALRMRWFFRLRNPRRILRRFRADWFSFQCIVRCCQRTGAFDAFLAHQFQESVQDDPLSLHFLVRNPENYGITEPEMKFPEYSLEQLQKDSEENAAILEELLPSIPLS